MMNKIDLSIIIVNYNGKHFLKECFASIKNTCEGINYEIIVFDNASQDGSTSYIESKFSNVNLIKSYDNLGFAKGNNNAVKIAKGKFILLLNNDTELRTPMKPLLTIIDSDDVGALGIKMLGKEGEYRKSVGKFPSPSTLIKLSRLYYSSNEFNTGIFNKDVYEVDWIEGSFLLTKKDIWDKIGGLDETYFMYVEDVDYCKEVRKLNKKCIYISNSIYFHFGGYNSGRQNLLKMGFKNYIYKNKKGLSRLLCRVSIELNYLFKNVKKDITKSTQ